MAEVEQLRRVRITDRGAVPWPEEANGRWPWPDAEGFGALPWPDGQYFFACAGQTVEVPAGIAGEWLEAGLAVQAADDQGP